MHSRLKIDIAWTALVWAAIGAPISQRDVEVSLSSVRETFSSGHLAMGLSVRTIFDAVLSELAPARNAPILMSGINIQNMADIVVSHKLRLMAVDVNPETLAPAPGTLADTQASCGAKLCVVTQLFGSVNAIEDAEELKRLGVFIIEDAAQAFAGAFHHGAAGADVSLFSFGPIKRRTALGGAVAVFQDADLAARVRARLQTYPIRSEMWFRQRAAKYLLLKAASTPWIYGLVMRGIAVRGKDPDAVIGGVARSFSGNALLKAIKWQPPRRMLALMARQIAASPDYTARRQACSVFLDALPDWAKVGAEASNNAYWIIPVRPHHPGKFIEQLRRAGFDATRGATSLRALTPEKSGQARELIENVVYVPNPADLDDRGRRDLQQTVVSALSEGG